MAVSSFRQTAETHKGLLRYYRIAGDVCSDIKARQQSIGAQAQPVQRYTELGSTRGILNSEAYRYRAADARLIFVKALGWVSRPSRE